MTDSYVNALINYALAHSLIEPEDAVFYTNKLLFLMKKDDFDPAAVAAEGTLSDLLNALCDDAAERGVIENSPVYRDLFDTALMGAVTPRPSYVIRKFNTLYALSPEKATEYYYTFSRDTNYIRTDRIKKDIKWTYENEYGTLDITINMSKPEKDPKAIAAARNAVQSGYPKCQLCCESEGYAGRVNFPARENHRIIPITLGSEQWFLQYSPYVYYNEHCIALNSKHVPMKIDREAFRKLLSFTEMFPHYFIGSNADLPIVGGSILTHEHFQGGHYEFAMAKAPIERELDFKGFGDIEAGIVKWPMSVIRLRGENSERLAELGGKILDKWRSYTDESVFVFAETDSQPHNTITPIARKRDGKFELDLVLRNNITTEEHPLGVFHPHAELHHIKKENIGLIEVMGLAVLPSRLKNEMHILSQAIIEGKDLRADESTVKHAEWAYSFMKEYSDINRANIDDIIQIEVGKVFSLVLEHAGVFKRDEKGMAAFLRFAAGV